MPIRVGVVGVGNLGQYHARVYHDLKEATLVGVVDSSPDRAKEIAKKQKTQAFTSLEELLKAGVEAVSVVVPTSLHHEVATRCLEAGCHVLLEKPIASTVEQADDLTRLAHEKGRILQIGHIERFNQAVQALQKLKTVPKFIESHRMGPFVARNLDTGVVLDLMIHDIDIILNLVQSKVVSVEGVGIPVLSPTEDIANAREKFAEIRTRMLQMDRDYKVAGRSMYEGEGWRAKNDRFGHAMVAWSDALSAVPTGEPMIEADAVAYANSVVRQAHGTALESARSNFMQSKGVKGLFGTIYGFMNNSYGQTRDIIELGFKLISGPKQIFFTPNNEDTGS